MKRMLKNKNILVLGTVIILALTVLIAGILVRNNRSLSMPQLQQIQVSDTFQFSEGNSSSSFGNVGSLIRLISSACAQNVENPEATEQPASSGVMDPTSMTREGFAEYLRTIYTKPGYVLVYLACTGQSGVVPLRDAGEEDYVYTVTQDDPYGGDEKWENTIHIDSEGVWVESANCAGQDCVGEGKVTLENISSRVLGNMILCSAHQLWVELYTQDEIIEMVCNNYFPQ